MKIWIINKINKRLESVIVNTLVKTNTDLLARDKMTRECINQALLYIPNNSMANYPRLILENALRHQCTEINDSIKTNK